MDMENLMAQAKQLQDKVAAAQDALAKTVLKGIAGNGMVIVEMTGKYDLLPLPRGLVLNPEVLKKDLPEIAALIHAAFLDAKNKADATIDKVMGEATAGMPMPE
jgi:DNA-binding YbaB/EbfC family protein